MIEWLSALRDLLVDNLERSHLPLPVDPGVCKKWREGLSFGGRERVLYTSCMPPDSWWGYDLALLSGSGIKTLRSSSTASLKYCLIFPPLCAATVSPTW